MKVRVSKVRAAVALLACVWVVCMVIFFAAHSRDRLPESEDVSEGEVGEVAPEQHHHQQQQQKRGILSNDDDGESRSRSNDIINSNSNSRHMQKSVRHHVRPNPNNRRLQRNNDDDKQAPTPLSITGDALASRRMRNHAEDAVVAAAMHHSTTRRRENPRFIAVRGERHSGTNLLRAIINTNCFGIDNADDRFGWKHDPIVDWEYTLDDGVMLVLLRDAATWLPALAKDTFEARFYKMHMGEQRPDPSLTVTQLMQEPFPRGPTSDEDYDNAIAMRTEKYRSWVALSELHQNVVIIRYEELAKNQLGIAQMLAKRYGFSCFSTPSRFKPITREETRTFGHSLNSTFTPRAVTWSEEDWNMLRNTLDLAFESDIGYTYPQDGWSMYP